MGCLYKSQKIIITLFCIAILSSNLQTTFSQSPGRARVGRQTEQRPRQSLARPEMRVPKLSPEMEKILKDWYVKSSKVNKLEGKHHRFVYDSVFKTEKRASGVFYYENPDKGHMAIEPTDITRRGIRSARNGFKLKKDHQTKWICDGKRIMSVNEKEKTYEVHPIPPGKQGANIMDGPLPFLFGMPPKKAKLRYHFKLLKETKDIVLLDIRPKWRQDAANWSEAKVILTKATYLPQAVQMKNPAKTLETVYQFYDLRVNKQKRIWTLGLDFWDKKPFAEPGRGYKEVKLEQTVATEGGRVVPKLKPGYALVPAVIGMSYVQAEKILTAAGFKPQRRKGSKTTNKKLHFHVESQEPRGRTPHQKGQAVMITIYLKG